MTVKELKAVLDACNDTAEVLVNTSDGIYNLEDKHIFQIFDLSDEGTVIFYAKPEVKHG